MTTWAFPFIVISFRCMGKTGAKMVTGVVSNHEYGVQDTTNSTFLNYFFSIFFFFFEQFRYAYLMSTLTKSFYMHVLARNEKKEGTSQNREKRSKKRKRVKNGGKSEKNRFCQIWIGKLWKEKCVYNGNEMVQLSCVSSALHSDDDNFAFTLRWASLWCISIWMSPKSDFTCAFERVLLVCTQLPPTRCC